MSTLDWVVISVYLIFMVGLGFYLGRDQKNTDDYYVGGRNFPGWLVGVSTMATQTSAISFISIPAFVALKSQGGLNWLQYELAVPLAMVVIMIFLTPFFRQLQLVSLYEYLEQRFNPAVRYLVSAVFLLSRGLGTGVGLYAAAIVLSVCSGFSLAATIIILGVVTVIYDMAGGIKAVVISDFIQMLILVFGLALCIFYAANLTGGFGELFSSLPKERMQAYVPSTGFNDQAQAPFWAFFIGGFFLYIAYYGTDQSQVQRGLSTRSVEETKKSLLLNGLLRFPLTGLYLLLGIAMYAAFQNSTELQQLIPADKPDYLVPYFIIQELPTGLRGLLFAALLAATMSSLDSALNSLSAVTMTDFVSKIPATKSFSFLIGKLITLLWGGLITLFAFFVGDISDTVIEAINKVGSAFYGPVLAAFLLGILIPRVGGWPVFIGILVGVVVNLYLWKAVTGLHWMWWNPIGFMMTSSVAFGFSLVFKSFKDVETIAPLTLTLNAVKTREQPWYPIYFGLIGYSVLIAIVIFSLG